MIEKRWKSKVPLSILIAWFALLTNSAGSAPILGISPFLIVICLHDAERSFAVSFDDVLHTLLYLRLSPFDVLLFRVSQLGFADFLKEFCALSTPMVWAKVELLFSHIPEEILGFVEEFAIEEVMILIGAKVCVSVGLVV